MKLQEVRDKLRHYADTYGEWIWRLTPQQAEIISMGAKARFDRHEQVAEALPLLCESVHFETISQCLRVVASHD